MENEKNGKSCSCVSLLLLLSICCSRLPVCCLVSTRYPPPTIDVGKERLDVIRALRGFVVEQEIMFQTSLPVGRETGDVSRFIRVIQ